MKIDQIEWDKIMAEVRRNNAIFLNRHITRKIKVQYKEVPTEVWVTPSDVRRGVDIYFFEKTKNARVPF